MIPTITGEQKEQLDRNGYFVLENVFAPAEMDEVAERIEAHQRRHAEAIRGQGGTQGISRAEEITFTSHLAENDDALRDFVQRPEFVAIATAILGPDVEVYWIFFRFIFRGGLLAA
jgi:ectoine hydroxylase-related dioxygenase (phytanoyl-CoA dioxygenase family)